MSVSRAVILAAGMGSRLVDAYSDGPKGLLPIDGETLIARSTRLLRQSGIDHITLVVGFMKEAYEAFAAGCDNVALVENREFATTGTLYSLQRGLAEVRSDFLLLEADLFYEERALVAVLGDPRSDVVLSSGFTGAGDEVWVEAPSGQLRGLSKDRGTLRDVTGEFVGICKLSAQTRDAIVVGVQDPSARASYETDALVALAARQPIYVANVPDLLWGEVDDAAHLRRVRDHLAPAVRAKAGGRA